MACQMNYHELMSLELDGLLGDDDRHSLREHVGQCSDCSALWAAMRHADSLLIASAREPLPLSSNFTTRVMQRVAASPVYRPQVAPLPHAQATPVDASVLPALPGTIGGYSETPLAFPDFRVPEQMQVWQSRIVDYVRGMAAAVGAAAIGVGLLLTLIMTGTLQVGGILAPSVETLRALLLAVSTWAGSMLNGLSTPVLIGAAIVIGLVSFAGWQIVAGYHYSAGEQNELGAGEVLA